MVGVNVLCLNCALSGVRLVSFTSPLINIVTDTGVFFVVVLLFITLSSLRAQLSHEGSRAGMRGM